MEVLDFFLSKWRPFEKKSGLTLLQERDYGLHEKPFETSAELVSWIQNFEEETYD